MSRRKRGNARIRLTNFVSLAIMIFKENAYELGTSVRQRKFAEFAV